MDEFLARHFGRWSGLGPIDVLASILTINATEREELLNWRERHMSMFRALDMDQSRSWVHTVSARNLVNGQDYTIRIEQALEEFPFLPPRVVFGWLVPWHGEWCWSGEQRLHGEVPEAEDAKLRAETIRALGHFVYRYCPAELDKARDIARQMHEEFVQLYGSDVKAFPDGRTAQDTERKRLERWQHAHTELFGLPPGDARPLSLPPPHLESTQGVVAFSSPTTGVEYAREFKLVESGLAKNGQGLTGDEAKAIRGFIMAPEISPAFVQRALGDTGPLSIFEAFAIRDYPPDTALQFLLRRHKGEWFAKTYPNLLG